MHPKWYLGLSVCALLGIVLGSQLFGASHSDLTPIPENSSEEQVEAESCSMMSDAERRYRTGQARHWRQLMLRR